MEESNVYEDENSGTNEIGRVGSTSNTNSCDIDKVKNAVSS